MLKKNNLAHIFREIALMLKTKCTRNMKEKGFVKQNLFQFSSTINESKSQSIHNFFYFQMPHCFNSTDHPEGQFCVKKQPTSVKRFSNPVPDKF